jgi:hypothetical protein
MYDTNGNIVTRDTPESLLVTNPLSGAVRPAVLRDSRIFSILKAEIILQRM